MTRYQDVKHPITRRLHVVPEGDRVSPCNRKPVPFWIVVKDPEEELETGWCMVCFTYHE